ncbi:HD domain-containing phosphohydrolase [Rhodoferax saidenbachensis]|uniref:Metal-dependent phosphohydrolase n=1 Tax=Rhodoferax saidenbachensis TaxID=1484693 RepID=A0A1P8K665_9BURK|nr:HD domain-containing phosphohydrolase [Rhodoferax saidenbachensis]APW41502.1 metal-dependent phosphohydrolase [Rhodoferax saidenbachensis]
MALQKNLAPGPENPGAPTSPGWPIKLSIASVVVLSMVILAITIIALGWVGARQSLLDAASKSARDAGLLITEKSHRMLEPAQATLRLLTSTPLSHATTLEQRLDQIRTLSDVLVANSLMSSVFVGYADGSFFLVRPLDQAALRERFRPPPKANFLVQSIQMRGGKPVGEFLFFDTERRLLERRAQTDYQFDPRTRPWYRAAQASSTAAFTEPYVFFTTRQVGLTLSQASLEGGTVFGIDVVLDDLATSLSDLRTTPNAQLALVNAKDQVLAYPDMNRVLVQGEGKFDFRSIQDLGVPGLTGLHALHAGAGKVVPYDVAGTEWLGVVLPFDVWQSEGLHLLVAVPSDDLLGDLKSKAVQLALVIIVLALLLMPLGWLAGAAIGRRLDRLTALAQRMSQFDFHRVHESPNFIREVNSLSAVMGEMGETIETFLQISQDMATEPQVERMLHNVLQRMVSATRCQGGAVYLVDSTTQTMQQAAVAGYLLEHDQAQMQPGSATTSGARREVMPGLSEMQVELRGRSGKLEGLLVLQHASDTGHADASFTEFVHKLSGMLAVSIETRQLIEAQKALLDAVIRLMADAIDAKSPYTGGHCERVPELAGMLVDRMVQDSTGPYAAFTMNEDERYEFHLGAWLHDCGKVTSPEHIIDKATKLETIYNRIHEVRMRFEVLRRDAEITFWQGVAQGGDRVALQAALTQHQAQLQEDFAFVARCNVGGEFMADADVARLQSLAQTPWVRHFDNRLGLSSQELMRVQAASPEARPLPVQEQLLADRPDHVVPWGTRRPPVEKGDPKNRYGFDMQLPVQAQHMGEVYNLSIRRGTLTEEDRFKINDHIVQTLIMLKSLPWPAHLARVPDIAATHHEKLDGKGYPRKLQAAQLTLPDRVMALADIFEALTAADRPYKAAKTLTESLRIMAFMAKDQHIDAQLFRYFLHSGVWQSFAQQYMQPAQIDVVDITAIENLLPAAVA